MGFTGDIQRLNALASELEGRLPMALRNRVAIATTRAVNELLEEEFGAGIGPDGESWAGLASSTLRRGRSNPPLGRTSVQKSTKARRVGTHVAVESSAVGGYHQRGHASPTPLPRRPMWPEPAGPMPERWELAISLAANGAIVETLHATLDHAAE